MARDPLLILSRIRRQAVEQARQALGICVHAESQAEERVRVIDQTIARGVEAGRTVEHDHNFFEMSAIWLQAMTAQRKVAVEILGVAVSRSEQARGKVVTERTAAEAVGTLIAEYAAAAEADANKRLQHVLDDISRTRHRMRHENTE
jgi:hypothetical protein